MANAVARKLLSLAFGGFALFLGIAGVIGLAEQLLAKPPETSLLEFFLRFTVVFAFLHVGYSRLLKDRNGSD